MPGPHARKHLGVSVVEEVGRPLEQRQFPDGLHRAHLVHHRRAVDHAHAGQVRAQAVPIGRAEKVALEADDVARQSHVIEDLRHALDRRLDVALIDFDVLDPGVPARAPFGEGIEHDARLAVSWPDQERAAG